MRRNTLNLNIDTNITNVTTDDAITPSIDGANRKSIADYVDALFGTSRAIITATNLGTNLSSSINEVITTAPNQKVILLDSALYEVGQIIYVYKNQDDYNLVDLQTTGTDRILRYSVLLPVISMTYNGIYGFKKIAEGVWLLMKIIQDDQVTVSTDFSGNTIVGNGTNSSPIRLGFYKVLRRIYALGSNNPLIASNFSIGQYLPVGVTVSMVRSGVGLYRIEIFGESTLPALECTGIIGTNIFLTIHNSKSLFMVSSTYIDDAPNRFIDYVFENRIDGVLTDGFNNGEVLEVNFFVQ